MVPADHIQEFDLIIFALRGLKSGPVILYIYRRYLYELSYITPYIWVVHSSGHAVANEIEFRGKEGTIQQYCLGAERLAPER